MFASLREDQNNNGFHKLTKMIPFLNEEKKDYFPSFHFGGGGGLIFAGGGAKERKREGEGEGGKGKMGK